MTRDRCTGLVALMLGILTAAATSQLPPSTIANDIGPKAFPYITSFILIVSSHEQNSKKQVISMVSGHG